MAMEKNFDAASKEAIIWKKWEDAVAKARLGRERVAGDLCVRPRERRLLDHHRETHDEGLRH